MSTTDPDPGRPDAGRTGADAGDAGGAGWRDPGPDPDAGAEAAGPASATREIRSLRRSTTDRKLAGVCGGVGRWLDIDPLVFRVVLPVLTFFGGTGVVLYGLAWLLVPEDGEDESEGQRLLKGRASASAVTAIVVIIVGMSLFGGVLGGGPGFSGLVLLAVVGGGLVAAVRQGSVGRPDFLGGPGSPRGTDAAAGRPSGTTPPAPPTDPGSAVGGYTPTPRYGPPPAYGSPYRPVRPPAPRPSRPPRERSALGALTLSVALVAVGIVASIGISAGTGIDLQVVLAVGLAVVGAGLLVGAWVGRARGLIGAGLALTLVLVATASYDTPLVGGVGERVWAPASASDVESPYRLGAGHARLDLSAVDVAPGRTVPVTASLAVGQLTVTVPRDVDVEGTADVGVGSVRTPDGQETSVLGTERTLNLPAPASPGGLVGPGIPGGPGLPGEAEQPGTVVLDLEVGIGQVEVLREAA